MSCLELSSQLVTSWLLASPEDQPLGYYPSTCSVASGSSHQPSPPTIQGSCRQKKWHKQADRLIVLSEREGEGTKGAGSLELASLLGAACC